MSFSGVSCFTCSPRASSASATSVSSPTEGAPPCCHGALPLSTPLHRKTNRKCRPLLPRTRSGAVPSAAHRWPQETVHVSLIKVAPLSGKATLGTWWCHGHRGARAQNRDKPTYETYECCEQSLRSRGECVPALEPRGEDESSQTRGQDFNPDLGNSAVRNYRGASENVAKTEL